MAHQRVVSQGHVAGGDAVLLLDVVVVARWFASSVFTPAEAVVQSIFDLDLFEPVYISIVDKDATVVGAVVLAVRRVVGEHWIVFANHFCLVG